jgi:hypothetical protein
MAFYELKLFPLSRFLFFLFPVFLFQSMACRQTSTRLEESEFFASLSLDYPGLETVSEAVTQKNYLKAKEAYIEFLRKRTYRYPGAAAGLPPHYPSQQREEAGSLAEQVLDNTFTNENYTWQFPGEIDWHFNPTDSKINPGYSGEYIQEWTVNLNRLYAVQYLADAFQETGNPVYVAKIDRLIRSWIKNSPPEEPDEEEIWVSAWRSLEAGIRAGESWPASWVKVVQCRELADTTVFDWVKSWMEHGNYLEKHQGSLNWLSTESKALYTIGVLFPEFKQSGSWRELAVNRLTHQLKTDFYPDGAHVELSPHYHRLSAATFADVYKLAQLNKEELPPDFTSGVESLFEYLFKISMPDRYLPRLNDASDENLKRITEKWALPTFPERQDYQWILSDGRTGAPPSYTSVLLPWAGQAVMRNDWSQRANFCLFEYGPYGSGAHQHEDKLGVHLAALGSLFVYEAGTENYGNSRLRDYCLSTAAHSAITIDGMGQNRKKAENMSGKATEKYPATWTSTPVFDYATSVYGENPNERYGASGSDLGKWQRHILFLKPNLFFIADILTPAGHEIHTYQSHFHLNADTASLHPSTEVLTIAEKGRPVFTITPLQLPDLTVEVVKGRTKPEMLGWELSMDRDDRPIPVLRYSQRRAGPIIFSCLFEGTPAGSQVSSYKITQKENAPAGTYLLSIEEVKTHKKFSLILPAFGKTFEYNSLRNVKTGLLIDPEGDLYDLETGQVIAVKNSPAPFSH